MVYFIRTVFYILPVHRSHHYRVALPFRQHIEIVAEALKRPHSKRIRVENYGIENSVTQVADWSVRLKQDKNAIKLHQKAVATMKIELNESLAFLEFKYGRDALKS